VGILDTYRPGKGFSEVFADGAARPHYEPLLRRLSELTPEEMDDRARPTDATLRNLGITFAVYGGDEGVERTWPLPSTTASASRPGP